MKICVPDSTLQKLINGNISFEFNGFSIFDMWSSITLTSEIAKYIAANNLEYRNDYFDF